MSKVLVFTEFQNGNLKRSSQELLQFAATTGKPVVALALGSQAKTGAAQLAHHGAQEVLLCADTAYDAYNPELFSVAAAEAIQQAGASLVLASASSSGKDLFPRVAAKIGAGVVSDGTEITVSGDDVKVKKPMYAGKCFATAQFENAATKIVLMRANQLPVAAADTSKTATITEHAFTKPSLKTLIKEVVKGASEKLDLTEANVVVSGGRGLKEAANFSMLNDLASVLGATVGASRAVVDAGWVGHSMQVGQTGKTVAPTLYIAVGISGAIQHLAGMSGSKVIVAINNDPNAPIFQKATYGIVGDAFEIVPKLTEEFKKILAH
ncbi:electron transfer flavoprotein subunit alpha/FixB family protein [Pseudobdellovibrio exovorus]|uniref:Electron transfer flavoprotein subunit alpha n=1 Tax=Pseudobdellovibrio exovorus JSS TaxID=1184267 RepID=M4V4H9_9BACT|nr:electron transfer flavoprotein subunit alpha/FixB family protein [Pseudobdellovibrio exovorus]AGH94237.1 electron transfer flavoprotein subunit alpha [Pseudobdellovibrio exovorus JSS]